MKKIQLIAIVGGSASGKTWLAKQWAADLGVEAAYLSLDSFYRDLSHLPPSQRAEQNFDDPSAIDWHALRLVLESLEREEVAQVPVYDFTTHLRAEKRMAVASRPYVVLEGLWLLHLKWLREKVSLSVFVDCAEELRLQRRLERDVATRGRTEESVRAQFFKQVQPMHARFVEPQRKWAMRCVNSPLTERVRRELFQCGLGS